MSAVSEMTESGGRQLLNPGFDLTLRPMRYPRAKGLAMQPPGGLTCGPGTDFPEPQRHATVHYLTGHRRPGDADPVSAASLRRRPYF